MIFQAMRNYQYPLNKEWLRYFDNISEMRKEEIINNYTLD
jgi:hypothetical protein